MENKQLYNDNNFINKYMYKNRFSKKRTLIGSLTFLILGIILIIMGFSEYNDIAEKEITGGTVTMHSLIMLLYKIGGKEWVRNGIVGLGIFLIIWAVYVLLKKSKQ